MKNQIMISVFIGITMIALSLDGFLVQQDLRNIETTARNGKIENMVKVNNTSSEAPTGSTPSSAPKTDSVIGADATAAHPVLVPVALNTEMAGVEAASHTAPNITEPLSAGLLGDVTDSLQADINQAAYEQEEGGESLAHPQPDYVKAAITAFTNEEVMDRDVGGSYNLALVRFDETVPLYR